MRLGALLSTITSILMLVNILSLTLYYVGALEISNEFAVFLGLIVFASIIPGLIFIIYWILATGNFKRYSPTRLWTGRIGIVLQLVGAIFWIVLSELIGTYKEVLFLYAAYLIIDITGYVLFAAMLIRLAGEPKINSKFRTTGIIYLLGGGSFHNSLLFISNIGADLFVGLDFNSSINHLDLCKFRK